MNKKPRHTDRKAIPKEVGPNGKALCTHCRKEVSGRRRTFCSDECVHEYKIRKDPKYMRKCVLDRDKGVCAECGLDCRTLELVTPELCNSTQFTKLLKLGFTDCKTLEYVHPFTQKDFVELFKFKRPFWEVDHILPVCEGGGSCGLDNLRTLCTPCHKKVTSALNKKRSRNKDAVVES